MSVEVVLFLLIGSLAVFAAVMMLLTENAVHSALFLILNFACVAFLFLMLDAPFLALVQVAVYAGAIMVLFLFVIMLLGAERATEEVRQFKWLAPITLTLSVSFLIVVSFAFLEGDIDEQLVSPQQPMLRVINATPDFPEADIYLNGELFAADVPFGTTDEGEVASFETVQPGEYSLSIAEAGSEGRPLPLGTFDIEGGESLTVVTYGIIGTDIRPSLVAIDEDITYFDDQGGRLIVLNVYDDLPLRVVDAGTDRIFTADEATDAPVIYESLLLGEPTEQTVVRAGNKDWVFTPAIAEGVAPSRVDEIIVRPPPSFGVEEGVSNLMIVARDRDGESFLPVLLPVVTEVLPQFGSPEAIGNVLFVDYVFQFELVAVLLLAAMVGAIVLTQRPQVRPKPGRPTRRKVSRPLTSVIATQTGHSISVEEPPRAVTKTEPDSETSEPTGD